MAIANLHETLMTYKLRANELNLEITEYQAQKTLATYSTADAQQLKNADDNANRRYYKELYESDEAYYKDECGYLDYTEIPDFEEMVDKITAKYEDELNELTAWETELDSLITTASAELEEVNAYKESIQSMLQNNIQEDFNYGLS